MAWLAERELDAWNAWGQFLRPSSECLKLSQGLDALGPRMPKFPAQNAKG